MKKLIILLFPFQLLAQSEILFDTMPLKRTAIYYISSSTFKENMLELDTTLNDKKRLVIIGDTMQVALNLFNKNILLNKQLQAAKDVLNILGGYHISDIPPNKYKEYQKLDLVFNYLMRPDMILTEKQKKILGIKK